LRTNKASLPEVPAVQRHYLVAAAGAGERGGVGSGLARSKTGGDEGEGDGGCNCDTGDHVRHNDSSVNFCLTGCQIRS